MSLSGSWKHLVVLGTVAISSFGVPGSVRADIITDWNTQELTRIRTTSMDPLYASRDLAILQVAMFDAINGVNREDAGFLVTQDAPAGTSMGATLAAVGLKVMSTLYGSNSAFTSLYNAQIASLTDSPAAISQGVTWGNSVATAVINARATDGASSSNPAFSASGVQGEWAPTPPAFGSQPLRPGWADVVPFALNTGSQFRPNGPPTLDASAYVVDFNQVKSLGQDVSLSRTPDNTNIATFWNDPQGTVTTSGHWNQALHALTTGLSLNEKAKVFAAVNIAMADAAIAAWDAKYSYKSWRPVTAIRDEATRDGALDYDNPNITGDAAWTPLFATPVSPEYVSLTGALSQAAATTLANLLGGDVHSFSITSDIDSDGTADMTRSYSSFSQASTEAGRAGIYGGSQFNSSVQGGRTLGEDVAKYVTDNFFTPIVITAPANGATLSSLTLSSGSLIPTFTSVATSYTAVVSNSTATITATPTVTYPLATVAVNGTTVSSATASEAISLNLGGNLITVLVTAEDGITTTTYTINVIRAIAPVATTMDATNVTGSGATVYGTVNANDVSTTATFEYGLTTAYGSSAMAPQSPLTGGIDALVSATLSGLAPGSTYHFRVKAVSPGGTSLGADATFTTPSTNAALSGLTLDAGTLSPVFAGGTTAYTSMVSTATASVTVTPTVAQAQATVIINGNIVSSGTASDAISLNYGDNIIAVQVTAQDGTTTRTYTLNITRIPPAPEIEVEQVVGSGLADGAGSVGFGSVNTGSTSGALSFTIKNTGAADLTGLGITKNGANAAEFTVGLPGSTTLAPGASTTFAVTLSPAGAGARAAAIHIASNDADENPFDISLTGNGVLAPEIVVEQPAGTNLSDSSATVDFGTTPTSISSNKVFAVRNTGLGSLTGLGITIDGADPGLFSVIAQPGTPVSGSGGTTTFTVSFVPDTPGTKTATLHLASNDADEGSFDIALQGNGIPFPGILVLDGAGFTVNETDGTVTIPVKRTSGSFGSVTVNVSTRNGTARSPGDYTALSNVPVTLPDGVFSGSTTVSIVNTAGAEVNETFTVTLSSPTGGAILGAPVSAPVTIIDSTARSKTTDTAAPLGLAVSSPVAGASLGINTGGMVSITGTAADNKGVKQVLVSLNNGPFADAALGTPGAPFTAFNFPVTPLTGINSIKVKSIDYAGRESSIFSSSFTVLRPLAVIAEGALGSVSAAFSPVSFREAGKNLSITATPNPPMAPDLPGGIFTGWTLGGTDVACGGIPFTPQRIGVSAAALELPTLRFAFREGLVLTANFAPNPFAGLAGTYLGLVRPSATLPDRSPAGPGPEDGTARTNGTEGCFKATVTNTGAFSGKLSMDGCDFNMAGIFDHNGNARFGAARALTQVLARANKPGLVVALQIDLLTPGACHRIFGTVSATSLQRGAPADISIVDADRAFFNGATEIVPAEYLAAGHADGRFTIVFPARDVNDQPAGITAHDYPQGDGIGVMTVTKAGVVTVAGTLADGSAVSASGTLSEAMTFPLFVSLYSKLGFLSGPVALDASQPASDAVAAGLHWLRPVKTTSIYYPNGWPGVITVDLMAAKYGATAGQSVLQAGNGVNLQAADADGNVALAFSDGKLSGTLTKAANLSTADAVTKVPANDTTFNLTINRATGAISGSFTHTDATVPLFSGMIYQKGPNAGGYGYFLTKQPVPSNCAGESGGITLIGQP